MAKAVNVNMTEGPLLGKIIRFSVPLMLSGMLQLLYNAADVVVVGKWAGSAALAAVGSTGALVNLLINLFMGVSVGCNVLAARYYGAGDREPPPGRCGRSPRPGRCTAPWASASSSAWRRAWWAWCFPRRCCG